ncbi:MAG: cell wall-active antibiotics response protein LiaF [Anaerolineales bacterium]|jgi:lia operon protein LiaF
MKSRGQLLLGFFLILFGGFALLGAVTHIDVGDLFWPSVLIVLGVWFLVRPRVVKDGSQAHIQLLGDVLRTGQWSVASQEIWIGIADIDFDLTQAEVPAGVTTFRIVGFIGDIDLTVPKDVGVAVEAMGMVSTIRFLDRKGDYFLTPVHLKTDGYEEAERKVILETTAFIGDLKVRQY